MLITFSPPENAITLRNLSADAWKLRVVATPLVAEPEYPEVAGIVPTIPAY